MKSNREDLDSFDPKAKKTKLAEAQKRAENAKREQFLATAPMPWADAPAQDMYETSAVQGGHHTSYIPSGPLGPMIGSYNPSGPPGPMVGSYDPSQGEASRSNAGVSVRVCRNWAATGTCSFGTRCTFSHGDGGGGGADSGTSRPFRMASCKFWLQGSCPHGDRCTYKHGDTLMAPLGGPVPELPLHQSMCPTYFQTGTCTAAGCPHAHYNPASAPPPSMPPTMVYPGPRSGGPMSSPGNFLSRFGSKKSTPCKYGNQQACPFGERCHYSHT